MSASEIERHKENIQPTRSGRSASLLARRVQPQKADAVQLEQQRIAYEKQLTEDADNAVANPLQTWHSYVFWARVLSVCLLSLSFFSFF